MHLIIGEADGYIEEGNGNKYLTFASADKNKEVLAKYTEPWKKMNYLIKTVNGDKSGKYENFFYENQI